MARLNKDQIFQLLKEGLVEQLGVDAEKVTLEARFGEDLGADSLDLVEVIMEMEDNFGLKISDEDARSLTTVSEAVEFIYRNQASGGEADEGGASQPAAA